jgi:hypothetical protein
MSKNMSAEADGLGIKPEPEASVAYSNIMSRTNFEQKAAKIFNHG